MYEFTFNQRTLFTTTKTKTKRKKLPANIFCGSFLTLKFLKLKLYLYIF